MASRDSARPSYSAEWHRNNLTALACNGTGLITRTTTTTNIKGFFFPPQAIGNTITGMMVSKEVLGEFDDKDLCLIGTANASTGVQVSLSTAVERKDKVTYDSKDYLIRYVLNLDTGANVGQMALLKRIA
jgi:hypothetical protein